MLLHIFDGEMKDLPIYFISLSARHSQENVDRPSGLKNMHQVLAVLAGEGCLFCEGKEYRLSRGAAFYLAPGVAHAYAGDGLITAWITYTGEMSEQLSRYIGEKSFVFKKLDDTESFVSHVSAIERAYFEKHSELELSARLYSMLAEFFGADRGLGDMERALLYLEKHFPEHITLERLCEVSRLSRSAFSKRFKARFGMSAFDKLMEIRLLNAELYLKLRPSERVYVVAHECGFNDVGYFCKAYKRRFGRSPRGGG